MVLGVGRLYHRDLNLTRGNNSYRPLITRVQFSSRSSPSLSWRVSFLDSYMNIRTTRHRSLKVHPAELGFFPLIFEKNIKTKRPIAVVERPPVSHRRASSMSMTVLVPCHNEEKGIGACIESILAQTRKADQILVINDGSKDRSGEILASFGNRIEVITIPVATGNKSFAQERAIPHIRGEVFAATDGDTILDPRFLEKIEDAFLADPTADAVSGYVKSMRYNWLTACREIEYTIGQNIHKVAQSYLRSIYVIPGCAGAFRTDVFRRMIRFEHDTLTEDLDFTYKFHEEGLQIIYKKDAVVFTQDPDTLGSYINQMRRWYCGGWQNLIKHPQVAARPNMAFQLSLTYVEGFFFSVFLFVVPFVNLNFFLVFAIPYLLYVLVAGAYAAIINKRADLFFYAPTYIVLTFVNSYIFLEQFFKEVIFRKKNLVWYTPARRAFP